MGPAANPVYSKGPQLIQRTLCDVMVVMFPQKVQSCEAKLPAACCRLLPFAAVCFRLLPLAAADFVFKHTQTQEAPDQVLWGSSRRASKRRVRVPFLGNAFAGGSTFSSFHALQNIFSAVSPSRDPNTRCLPPPASPAQYPTPTPPPTPWQNTCDARHSKPWEEGQRGGCSTTTLRDSCPSAVAERGGLTLPSPALCLPDETEFTSAGCFILLFCFLKSPAGPQSVWQKLRETRGY